MASEFTWKVVDRAQGQAREKWRELAAQVQASVPQAARVTVTGAGGVQLLAASGEVLDLSDVPWALLEELALFFGLGSYWLAQPSVERPFQPVNR